MKRKLTEKQKQERKSKIKAVIFKILRIFSYICAGLFWLLIIIGIASGSCSPKAKTKTVIAHASTDVVEQGPIFYPTDFVGGNTKYYLHLNYRNYNQINNFFPNYDNFMYFDDVLNDSFVDTYTFTMPIYSDNYYTSSFGNGGIAFPIYNEANFSIKSYASITGLQFYYYQSISNPVGYTMRVSLSRNDSNSPIMLYETYSNRSTLIGMAHLPNSWVGLEYDIGTNTEYGCYFYELLDFFFKGDVYFRELVSDNVNDNVNNHIFSMFIAYYMSNYSFDFNGYQFGGLNRYLSTSYLFNRVYNGCFIYLPNNIESEVTVTLFTGLWEYHNSLFNRIDVTLIRAWNGYTGETRNGKNVVLDVNYTLAHNSAEGVISDDIYNGDNRFLENYYIIKEMYMHGVTSSNVTLAYNRISYVWVTNDGPDVTKRIGISLNENPMLYQTDSFINNKSILFYVFKIDYDYRLLNDNFNTLITYSYYSDFFFATFDYTGLYGTKPPVNDNSTTSLNVFNPIFTIFSNGLTGLMSMFNAELLPGVTIGVIVLVPFTVTIILATVKLFKR